MLASNSGTFPRASSNFSGSRVYRSVEYLVHHLTHACCAPAVELVDVLARRWAKQDAEERVQAGSALPRALVAAAPAYQCDAPLLPAHRWPPTPEGVWCVLQPAFERFTNLANIERTYPGVCVCVFRV
jgi:hypothetical protein